MNYRTLALASAVIFQCFTINAQTATGAHQPGQTTATADTIVKREADYRVWQNVSWETNRLRHVIGHTNSFAELATGMHYRKNGQWVNSQERINLLPNGGAAATNGQHQVYFPEDIYNGVIKVVTPDGQVLQSHPLGICYYDGTNSVMIAQLTNSTGQLLPSGNQVIYTNCFTDFAADLVCTYRKSGFECDLVFREAPPQPQVFGMTFDATRLELLTEFFNTADPIEQGSASDVMDGLTDKTLRFGQLWMGRGKAFLVGDSGIKVPVYKTWTTLEGRTFLIEELPYRRIASQLQQLPTPAGSPMVAAPSASILNRVSSTRLLPPSRWVQVGTNNPVMHLARVDLNHRPGVVLDYTTMDGGTNDFTFQGDTTYIISGPLVIGGTTTIEGGTVIKYTTNGVIETLGPLICDTAPYRPAILTSTNDNTVGETCSGSTGSPQPGDVNIGLLVCGGPASLQYLRISYATTGIVGMNCDIWNSQFINCSNAIDELQIDTTLYNDLFSGCAAVVVQDNGDAMSLNGEQITADNCSSFAANVTAGGLTNSILTAIGGGTNNFALADTLLASSGSGVYKTVGAGDYYLATNSVYRNAGTAAIDPNLLAVLQARTTYPPVLLTNVTVSTNTILGPQAQRDTNATPDLGYHYDPIDYIADMYGITNAVLTLTNGVAVAYYDEMGIWLQDNSSITSIGTPLNPNWLVWYGAVQERSVALGTNGPSGSIPVNQYHVGSGGQSAYFRFSNFACPAAGGVQFQNKQGSSAFGSLWVQDCQVWGGYNELDGGNSTMAVFENNLFYRSPITAAGVYTNASLTFSNNLFYGASSVSLSQTTTNDYILAFNNDFDSCLSVNSISTCSNGYNAYLNCTGRLSPTNVNDIVLSNSLAYETGPLGNFYQPDGSPLINAGSTTANLVGLSHYTVQTNLANGLEVAEGTNMVSIGYHYIATNASGNPPDTDGDGTPDYLEDSNGDGVYDTDDLSNWLDYYNGILPVLNIISGNNQTVTNGFSQPLVVQVTATNAAVLTNAPLTFTTDTALLATSTNGPLVTNLLLRTDAGGYASVYFFQPASAPAINYVTVKAQSGTNIVQVTFTVSRVQGSSVVAWGYDLDGQCDVPSGLTNVVAIATTSLFNLALKNDGTVVGWGDDGDGQCDVPSGLTNAVAIAVSERHSLALKGDGTVLGWGFDGFGECDAPSGLTNVVAIAAGDNYSLGLKGDGTVVGWGEGANVPSGLTNVVAIAAGGDFSLALKSDGTVVAWGLDGDGECDVPSGLTNVVAIAAGSVSSLALKSDGTVVGWGFDGDGECDAPSGLTNVVAIAAGDIFSLALKGDGTVVGWGYDGDGEYDMPSGLGNVVAIAAGAAHGLALSQLSPTIVSPVIITQPASVMANAGGNATFHVVASGSLPLSYKWYYNTGTLLANATNATLTITNAQSTNAGAYSVVITNSYGSATSSVALLAVLVPPSIITQPTNQTVTDGNNTTISVVTAGGSFSYQWQFDGTNLPDGIITTMAGCNWGYAGDGGAATNTGLNFPTSVAADARGDLFIADDANNVIREVDTNGIITTVAGNGIGGYSGDGGAATNAQLNYPNGVAVDARGDLFVSDAGNGVIREVTANGTIITVAGSHGNWGYTGDGGPATNAELGWLGGVAVDAAGNLFIADTGNNVIREVTTNGIIATIAGNGTNGYAGDGGSATDAELSYPSGVVADTRGNLFIADANNDAIREVDTNGIITTVVGDGIGGYSGDGGAATNAQLSYPDSVAVDAEGDLFISDGDNGAIREVNTNGIITTVAGGDWGYAGDGGAATNAELAFPNGVAANAAGNLFIADSDNDRIREVNTNGVITTVVGNGTQGFSGNGIEATSTGLSNPDSVAANTTGDLFIADSGNNVIREVGTNGIVTTVAGNGTIGYAGDGGTATDAELSYPVGVVVDARGDLFIVDANNSVIREVGTNGIITTVAGNGTIGYAGDGGAATNAQLNYPNGVAVDARGDLFIADANNSVIREVNSNGIITTVAGNGIGGYSGDDGAATNAQLSYPHSVAMDASGNLFIADTFNSVIREVNSNGIITTVAGNGDWGFAGAATNAQLSYPNGVAVDTAGNLFITDNGNNVIREIETNGIITTVAGNGTNGYAGDGGPATGAELNYPSGIAVDATGHLFIADQNNNRIREVFFEGEDSPTLTLDNVTTNNAGNYSVIITSLNGSVTSSRATLTVVTPPSITVQPVSQTNVVGNSVFFSVGAIGASLSYQWQFDDAAIPGATNAALALLDVQSTNDGNYSVVVSNIAGSVTSSNAILTITIPSPPIIIAGATNLTVTNGGTIYISVNATGPSLSYQWQFDGTNLPADMIDTAVGNGSSGYSGDGGLASGAQLHNPQGVAMDAGGNLYIADANNNVIREVTTNGIIITVAGNYGDGGEYSGDGGPATSTNTALNYPVGVAVDAAGDLFIADSGNAVIREVTTNGIIITVVGNYGEGPGYSGDGGSATNAQLAGPNGVVVDAEGDLFIADSGNAVIREVTTNGIITTVAGNYGEGPGYSGDGGVATNAQLASPDGVVVDAEGDLFIADTGNGLIREVATNGNINTVAGNYGDGPGYSGDGGAATNAQLASPDGVVVDAVGDLFIADFGNNVIREVATNGNINTVAGNYGDGPGYSGDGGVATNAQLAGPNGVVVGVLGNLLIADSGNNVIRSVAFSDEPILALYNATLFDIGDYSVVVTNAYGSATSSNIALTVLVPPSIAVEPTSQVSWVGGEMTMSVGALGTSPLNYQWYYLGTNLIQNGNFATGDFTGWTVGGYFTDNPPFVSGNDGRYLGQNPAVVPSYGSPGYLSQTFPTEPGQTYQVSFWVKAEVNPYGSDSSPDMSPDQCIANWSGTNIVQLTSMSDGDATFVQVYATALDTTSVLSFGFMNNSNDVFLFDDVNVELIAAVSGATSANLVLTDVQPANVGGYEAIVTNSFGSVTSIVSQLSLSYITDQPVDQTNAVGNNTIFAVAATNTGPITYQWYFDTNTVLTGATNATLILNNVQTNQAGFYSAEIANSSGVETSSFAQLTVPFPAAIPAPSGIINWWPGEGNLQDIVGGSNGTPEGAITYTNGKVGSAISFDGSSYVSFGDTGVGNFGIGDFTCELWVQILDTNHTQAILSKHTGCIQEASFGITWVPGIGFSAGVSDDYGLVSLQAPFLVGDDGNWHHVAFTRQGLVLDLYVDGILVDSVTDAYERDLSNAGHLLFGSIICIGFEGDNDYHYLNGGLDEITFYNRALSSDEIQAVYNSSWIGKYTGSPVPPVTPTNFMATGISPGQLGLSWQGLFSPGDYSSVGYVLERKLGASGTYQDIGTVFTNYVDTTAISTNQYYYRVKATNYFGDSDYSAEISPPVVGMTSPQDWSLITTTNVITNTLAADASSAMQTVTNVDFYIQSVWLGGVASAPYTTNWVATGTGEISVAAKATDDLGNSQYSSAVHVTVLPDSDTDGDGIPDFMEVLTGTDPTNAGDPGSSPTNNFTAPNIFLTAPANAVLLP